MSRRDRCEIDLWLLWNTNGNLTPEVQNPQQPLTFKGHFKVTKVKMARITSTVAPKPGVPIDKDVHHSPTNKSAP
jgi:hypothetical protein